MTPVSNTEFTKYSLTINRCLYKKKMLPPCELSEIRDKHFTASVHRQQAGSSTVIPQNSSN